MKNMIAEIVPLVRLPRHLHFFDYLVPEEIQEKIKLGQVVAAPFRGRDLLGLVINLKTKTENPKIILKPLNKIIQEVPVLTELNLALARESAEFYRLSLAIILKMMLPPLQKRKLQKIAPSAFSPSPEKKSQRPLVLFAANQKQAEKFYQEKIKENLTQQKQTLIIFPEIWQAKKFFKTLSADWQAKTVLYHSELGEKEQFWAWFSIKNNEAKIILGTRSAIFAPADHLATVILDREPDENHKHWDQNPRFHSRDVALMLLKIYGLKLILASPSPSIESYYLAQKKVFELAEEKNEAGPPYPTVIDLKQEHKKKNYTGLSDFLVEELLKAIHLGNVFLLLNRKGMATSLQCRDCGLIAKCPHCELPLIYYEDQNILACHYCRQTSPLPLECPHCQSVNLRMAGLGLEKIIKELKLILAEQKLDIPLIKIDKETNSLEQKKYSIIIGTTAALKFIDWPSISLMAILNADLSLSQPEFRNSEKIFDLLYNLAKDNPHKSFIIQTFNPELPTIRFASLLDYQGFFNSEILNRRLFHYPPFSYLLRLIFPHQKKEIALQEAQKLFRWLKKNIPNQRIEISPPLAFYPPRVRGRYRFVILIKLPLSEYKKLTKQIVKSVPTNWIVDPNPINILG